MQLHSGQRSPSSDSQHSSHWACSEKERKRKRERGSQPVSPREKRGEADQPVGLTLVVCLASKETLKEGSKSTQSKLKLSQGVK